MRNIVIIIINIFSLFICANISAQEGPGGVGNSSNIDAWMDASKLGLSNNDAVSSWTDVSGNNNHADEATNQPTFLTNQINGLAAIDFDGVNDKLEFTSSVTATATTIFSVVNPSSSAYQCVLATDNHYLGYFGSAMRAEFRTGLVAKNKAQSFSISYLHTSSEAVLSTTASLFSDNGFSNGTRTGFKSNTVNSIGSQFISGSFQYFFGGQMAELIVFNEQLNSAKRKIVANYLAAKYDLVAEQNLYSHKTNHGNDVIGIGQESDGSHTDSRGMDSLQISNPSSLNDGDYILIGNDGGSFSASTSVGSDATQRWTKVWRADVRNTPGTIDLTFYLGTNDFAVDPNNYVVLIENTDGDFSNGGTSIQETGMVYDALNGTVSFTGITISDNDYFTLAEKFVAPTRPTPIPIDFGPGGVGSTASLDFWLDASRLSLSNNDPVSSWTDVSGNQIDANQSNASNQPTYLTSQINGLPAIEFNGVDDRLEFDFENTATATTTFTVVSPTSAAYQCILATDNHFIGYFGNAIRSEFQSGLVAKNKAKSFSLSYLHTSSEAVSSTTASLFSDNGFSNGTRTGFKSNTVNSIGSQFISGSFQYYFVGQMAEIIVFNEQLNSAKRKIVANYLSSKYNLVAEQNLYAHKTTYGNDVIGIGQESDGNHTESRGLDSLQINNPSALDDGDYILVGNDGGSFNTSANVGTDASQRWTKVWRADVRNTPGTVDLTFYLGSNDFAVDPNHYAVYIENVDGDFTNGGTSTQVTGRVYDAINNTVSFTGITISDNDYFTLAESDPNPTAIADGNWESTSTWSCGCIPTSSLSVEIPATFDVTINSLAIAQSVTIASGASLTISGSNALSVLESLTIAGTLNSGSGSLVAIGTTSQTFANTSGSNVALNNLTSNNSASLLLTGGWTLSNDLQVNSGTLDVTGADSLVLLSTASKTAQILESAGTFVGDYTLQRFISSRNSNFGNLSAPTSNATVASIDDDLKLSGVSGNNGNAVDLNGNTFYSVYSYNRSLDKADTITSTATTLDPGVGYEVYLFNSLTTMDDTTIDYVGTPNFGNVTPASIDQGFNLVGNPYQSFISFDNLDQTNIQNNFYIYQTNSGTYGLFGSGDDIAPGQGFWVEKTSAGTAAFNFEESDKTSSNSSTFLRKKNSETFALELSNNVNFFKNKVEIAFDYSATEGIDQFDASYLPSPLKNASEIYTKTIFSDKLIKNTLNQFEESHLIPLELKIGDAGTYHLNSNNLNTLLENYSCVYLADKETNENIDLSVNSNYTFNSEPGISNRFSLILSNSYEACENKLNDDQSTNQKIDSKLKLRESYKSWFLDYNLGDKNQFLKISVYSLNGQQVIPTNEVNLSKNGSLQLSGLNNLSGIFVIQIIGQDEIINKTIKL